MLTDDATAGKSFDDKIKKEVGPIVEGLLW